MGGGGDSALSSPPPLERRSDEGVALKRGRTLWVTALPVGGGDNDNDDDDEGGGGGDSREPTFMGHFRAAREQAAARPAGGRAWHGTDGYALSCIMWEVFTLRPLWAGQGIIEIWRSVQRGARPTIRAEEMAAAPRAIAEGYVALMRELWAHRPEDRPTMEAVMRRLDGLTGQ